MFIAMITGTRDITAFMTKPGGHRVQKLPAYRKLGHN
jgi:hypothetical protein